MYSVLRALLPASTTTLPAFSLQHALEEIGAGIDLLLPVRGLVGAGVEALDAFEVLLQVRSGGRIDVHDRADLRIHELLDQARVEVAGVEGDEADGVGGGGGGEGGAHGEEGERVKSEARRPKAERNPKAEGRRQGRVGRCGCRIRALGSNLNLERLRGIWADSLDRWSWFRASLVSCLLEQAVDAVGGALGAGAHGVGLVVADEDFLDGVPA